MSVFGRQNPYRIAAALAVVVAVGCRADGSGNSVPPAEKWPILRRPVEAFPSTVVAPPAPVRRLTRDEYRNSIQDLLEFDAAAAVSLLAIDTAPDGLRTDVKSQLHSESGTEGYARAAEEIATQIPWEGGLRSHASCTEITPICVTDFVNRLGRLLLQRPLSSETTELYSSLFWVANKEGLNFEDGARLVLRAMLQSPGFLFVTGPMQDGRFVDSRTLASRMSLFLWKAIPDAALSDSVDRGAFKDEASSRASVAAMLKDPRVGRGLRAFVEDWLKLHTLDLRTPPPGMDLASHLYADMKTETLALIERLALTENAPILSMFLDRYTELPPSIAPLYGYEPVGTAGAMVDLGPDPYRIGLLTQPAFLALSAEAENTSIVRRGLTILRTFLCEDIPAPPASAAVLFALLPDTLSERERFALHSIDPACSNCHQTFEPFGLAFEPYDGLGRHHFVDDRGNFLRQDGEVTMDGATQAFRTISGFAAILGQSETIERCVISRILAYALGRQLGEADVGMVEALSRSFLSLPRENRSWTALLELVANHPVLHYGDLSP